MTVTIPVSLLLAVSIEVFLVLLARHLDERSGKGNFAADYTGLACLILAVLIPPFWLGWFARGLFR